MRRRPAWPPPASTCQRCAPAASRAPRSSPSATRRAACPPSSSSRPPSPSPHEVSPCPRDARRPRRRRRDGRTASRPPEGPRFLDAYREVRAGGGPGGQEELPLVAEHLRPQLETTEGGRAAHDEDRVLRAGPRHAA